MASGSASVPLSRAETLVNEDIINSIPINYPELDQKKDPLELAVAEELTAVQPLPRKRRSLLHKYALLIVFCLAQFLDVVNNSAILAAIPTIADQLHMASNEQVWVISATQLAFASFLLLVSAVKVEFEFCD